MTEKEQIKDIIFLSKKSTIKSMDVIRNQIKDTISKNNYFWQVGRIDDKGKLTFE